MKEDSSFAIIYFLLAQFGYVHLRNTAKRRKPLLWPAERRFRASPHSLRNTTSGLAPAPTGIPLPAGSGPARPSAHAQDRTAGPHFPVTELGRQSRGIAFSRGSYLNARAVTPFCALRCRLTSLRRFWRLDVPFLSPAVAQRRRGSFRPGPGAMGAEKMLLPAKEALRLPWQPQYNQAKLLVALNRVYRTILFIYLRERERVRGRLEGEREAHSPPSRDPRTPDSGPELKKD
ncbi:uncharacterized protein [Vulpes vulpes]|uniref:Uncharacterized protein n=1 Tax=Vulpes vulpes TaxID=9627 RepID=A0A3Q7SCM8_VULVU